MDQSAPLRLNLGAGQNPVPGFVNVDRSGTPEVKWDLEQFPWPWLDSSVDEILLNHVLEHLGESVPTFFRIIQELYRVCKHEASITVVVPHPRHDDFLGDPTHVRAFVPESFTMYSKAQNLDWAPPAVRDDSPLGLYLDVDLVVAEASVNLDEAWAARVRAGQLSQQELHTAVRQYNNVAREISVRWRVNKPGTPGAAPAVVKFSEPAAAPGAAPR